MVHQTATPSGRLSSDKFNGQYVDVRLGVVVWVQAAISCHYWFTR